MESSMTGATAGERLFAFADHFRDAGARINLERIAFLALNLALWVAIIAGIRAIF